MTDNSPLISFIISVYNDEHRITKALESVAAQSYKNIEIRIMDDASTDNTLKNIQNFASAYKNVYIYKNKENIGLTKSLNILIAESEGDYIARQDSDDISHYSRIKKQIDAVHKNNLDFCCTRAEINGKNKTIPGISFYLPKKFLIKYKNPFIHGTLLIKKKVIQEVSLYNENFYFSQDYKLMIDLIKNGYKFKTINERLYTLNLSDNISSNFTDQQRYYAKCAQKGIIPNSIV
jgi:glycosyltransferase involved in cell wall biosynthesis